MRLESLTIIKFGHVKPCTLEFANDLSVVLGKNGAGKTTLLKLIVALCKLDFSGFTGLSVDAVLRSGEWNVHLEIRQSNTKQARFSEGDVSPATTANVATNAKLTFSGSGGTEFWLEVGTPDSKNSGGVTAADVTQPLYLQVWDTVVRILSSSPDNNPELAERLASLQTAWAHLVVNLLRFDESLGTFDRITADAGQANAKLEIDTAVRRRLVPAELVAAWELTPENKSVFATVSVRGKSDLLDQWAAWLSWQELRAAISLEDERDGVSSYSGVSFFAHTANRHVRHENFSYGQKRFLSFLYYAACQDHLLIIDELANGLHHEWIEICFAEMKGKQTIMSSQNPLIFDHLEFNDAAAVSKALILCSQNEQGEMVWENMHAESAAHFFTSYERGIRQVSEILREQKLW